MSKTLKQRNYTSGPSFQILNRGNIKVVHLGTSTQSITINGSADNKEVWEIAVERYPAKTPNRRNLIVDALGAAGLI